MGHVFYFHYIFLLSTSALQGKLNKCCVSLKVCLYDYSFAIVVLSLFPQMYSDRFLHLCLILYF